jgi:hypothetical protein
MACKARTHLCGNARCVFEHALNWVVVGCHDRNFAQWIRSAQCAAFGCRHTRIVDLAWQQRRRQRWLVSCVWWCGRWLAGSEGQTLESGCVCETCSCLCLRVCERLFVVVLANSCACSCLHVRVRVCVRVRPADLAVRNVSSVAVSGVRCRTGSVSCSNHRDRSDHRRTCQPASHRCYFSACDVVRARVRVNERVGGCVGGWTRHCQVPTKRASSSSAAEGRNSKCKASHNCLHHVTWAELRNTDVKGGGERWAVMRADEPE